MPKPSRALARAKRELAELRVLLQRKIQWQAEDAQRYYEITARLNEAEAKLADAVKGRADALVAMKGALDQQAEMVATLKRYDVDLERYEKIIDHLLMK